MKLRTFVFINSTTYSRAILEQLVQMQELDILCMVLPGYSPASNYIKTPLFISTDSTLDSNLKVFYAPDNTTKLQQRIAELQPDLLLVTCFPYRIRDSILSAAPCINLHPSLLPAYRGPTPLFWQFQSGEQNFGVSIHRVIAKMDRGTILKQKKVHLEWGINKVDANNRLATCAINLLEYHIHQPHEKDDANGLVTESSAQGFPKEENYQIKENWSVQRAFNFVRGTAAEGIEFHYKDNIGNSFWFINADGFRTVPLQAQLESTDYQLSFRDGVLYVK